MNAIIKIFLTVSTILEEVYFKKEIICFVEPRACLASFQRKQFET
jgi:hypothetical protein